MRKLISPERFMRDLPGWQDANWSKLDGGLSNHAWLLQKDDSMAVLKIDDEPRTAPLLLRQEERDVQMAAASAGLAGAVLFASEQLYLTEFVVGDLWQPSLLDEHGRIEQLAAALRRLHGLPRTGRPFDAGAAAKRYVANLAHRDSELVALCLRVIRDTPLPNYLCCCHNDLVAENILTTPSIKFLDWEYACDNDPVFDLATIVEHHELSDEVALALLDAYFEGAGGPWWSRLADQRRLYLALYYLWSAAREESSLKGLQRLGARLSTSCS